MLGGPLGAPLSNGLDWFEPVPVVIPVAAGIAAAAATARGADPAIALPLFPAPAAARARAFVVAVSDPAVSAISVKLMDARAAPIAGAAVTATPTQPSAAGHAVAVAAPVSAVTDAAGAATLALFPHQFYLISARDAAGVVILDVEADIPAQDATLSAIARPVGLH